MTRNTAVTAVFGDDGLLFWTGLVSSRQWYP